MEENVTKINGGITINVDVSVKKNILYLESFYMWLQQWKKFSKYYGWFNNYVWWSYRVIQRRTIFNENKALRKI